MSSRIFQSVVLQMKDCSDRAVGVIDEQGTVVACNELAPTAPLQATSFEATTVRCSSLDTPVSS